MEQQDKNFSEFYIRLKEKLEENTNFPTEYLYKFIVPTHEDRIAQMYKVFDGKEAEISTKNSASGKYTSFSVKILAETSDEIIHFYEKAGNIEGIISL